MIAKNISGRLDEEYAAKHLRQNGYHILCRNYKTKIAEVDIIAADGNTLCFIEVKTRKSKSFGTASEAVDFHKREKIILGARCYLTSKPRYSNYRFDVVEVYGSIGDAGFSVEEINIIKNAFEA